MEKGVETIDPKNLIFFKILLNRFHQGIGENFLKNLPQEEAKAIIKQLTASQDASIALMWPDELLSRTHYSWLVPYIQQMSKPLQAPVIASLYQSQLAGLKKFLKIDTIPTGLAESSKIFLRTQLFLKWNPKEVIPIDFIPASPLSNLLSLSKGQLVELINFLAIYDLADAIRHIVDKKNLKALYLCLTPQEQQFLRVCLHKKEKITAPKLEIDKWDGQPQKLHELLHRRGIFRLGKALSGQSEDFLWHITHILDTGRGATLSQYYNEEETPGITPLLIQQVLKVLNFLNHKSES